MMTRRLPASCLHQPSALALACLLVSAPVLAQSQDSAPEKAAVKSEAARPAEAKPSQLERVEVNGGPSDEASRRASTAAKIIIGREEIERYGDSSVGEVLKRLPGVTTGGRPGRGGEVRMRGMGGGYTQILVNGERMPPGFSLDQLPPEQVERIEVMRAPTAEYGARAIAGTINVVLREALKKRSNEIRLAASAERGQLKPNAGWTRNDKLDGGGSYNITVNAMQNKRRDDVDTHGTILNQDTDALSTLRTQGDSNSTNSGLFMTGRLQLQLAEGETLALQPFAVVNKGSSSSQLQLSQTGSDYHYAYSAASTDGDTRFGMLRLNSQWNKRLDESSRLELRTALGAAKGKSHSLRLETGDDDYQRTQDDHTDSRDRSWSLNGKYSRQLVNEHSLVGGLEAEGATRKTSRICLQNGATCSYLLDFGDDIDAATLRSAAYVQDEWTVGKQWAFYAGLRWEGIETQSKAASYDVSNRSSVWTPLLHGVWKFSENSRDQIRMSLTRSYKSPDLQSLTAQPSISSQYPCETVCGANEADSPDRSGNPNLKPELATGIDIAYEKYLSKGGLLSANFFVRRITDLIRTDPRLETVSWASVQRWVSMPRNIGNARTLGVELEAKFRLDEYFEDALPINVRSNLSLFRSKVDGIKGPNNTLDQQPKYTANLGADYKLRSLPLTLGASLNYTPATLIQQSDLVAASSSRKRVIDASAGWAFDMNTQLRLSASNLGPLDYATGTVTNSGSKLITSDSGGRSFTAWQLRLEMKV